MTRARARELVQQIRHEEGVSAEIVLDTRSKRPTYVVVSEGRRFRSHEEWRDRWAWVSDLIVPVAIRFGGAE